MLKATLVLDYVVVCAIVINSVIITHRSLCVEALRFNLFMWQRAYVLFICLLGHSLSICYTIVYIVIDLGVMYIVVVITCL